MIDEKLTKEIQQWFDTEPKTDDVITEGAKILLRINRNQVLFQTICRKPQRFLSKVRYELQKHLRYRLDGLTLDEVRKMEKKVLPAVEQVMNEGQPDDDQTLTEEEQQGGVLTMRRGRRSDHDSLPDEIKALWDTNAGRYKKMKEAYYTCLGLDMACDRYEYVKLLSESVKLYKADMEKYDSWSPDSETKDPALSKAIDNARSYVSKNRPAYDSLVAGGDTEKAAALKIRIQKRIDLLRENNAALSDDLTAWLGENGFTLTEDEA